MPQAPQVVEANSTAHTPTSKTPRQFPSLELVTSPTLDTANAAFYLNRAEQTLRIWACHENGPIRPIRIHGRLAWPTAEIRRLVMPERGAK